MLESLFAEVAALLLAAALLGALALRLRQPLILAFIVVGVREVPAVLGWVTAADPIDLLTKIGIAHTVSSQGMALEAASKKRRSPDIGQVDAARDADWMRRYTRKQVQFDDARG